MFTQSQEQAFFLNSIDSTKKVLEYGSGQSTHEIAKICKTLVSIEHQKEWYEKVSKTIPSNCTLIHTPSTLPYTEGGPCGTYDQFKDYVESPLDYAPFDIIFIDGRARVACASICKRLGHKDSIVFIHDFDRAEYQDALKYLDLIDSCCTMSKFTIKYD
jgi:predicted O-methyltransferase YrrM